ncbi:MAG: type II toxin-antitoxin system HicB family antitoxin [bacterium]
MKRKTDHAHLRRLGRRYPVQLVECEEGGYVATVPDLPGCVTQGETIDEVMRNVTEARELWLEDALASGQPIPEPRESRRYSGRFVVRMPRELHARLAGESEREGVSLNQLVVARLAASPEPFVASDRPRRTR